MIMQETTKIHGILHYMERLSCVTSAQRATIFSLQILELIFLVLVIRMWQHVWKREILGTIQTAYRI